MKTILILLLAMVACAAARSLEAKGLPCGRNNVGKKVTYFGSAHKYLECTRKGLFTIWELKRCEQGTWFSSADQGCIGDESSEEDCDSPVVEPVESEESPEVEQTERPVSSEESGEVEQTEAPVSSEESGEVEQTQAPVSSEESGEVEQTQAPVSSEESGEVEPTEPPASGSGEDSGSVEDPGCEAHCSYHGEYLVNPESCNSFYQCSWGVAYLHDCPIMNNATGERLVFNPNLDVCDWPWAYECTGTPGCGQPEPEPECPSVTCEYIGQYLSNPSNCHSFYQCAWDHDHSLRAVLHNCAMETESTRLVWNAEINTCDWSYNVECNNSC